MKTLTEQLDVPEHHMAVEEVPIAGAENQIELCFLLQEVQTAAKFKAERHPAFFPSLAVVEDEQVVEIDLGPVNIETLTDSASRIEQGEGQRM